MNVLAAPGTRCPKEGRPREYISDVKAEDVPDTAYYLRLIAEGSLIVAPVIPAQAGIQEDKKKKKTNKEV